MLSFILCIFPFFSQMLSGLVFNTLALEVLKSMLSAGGVQFHRDIAQEMAQL